MSKTNWDGAEEHTINISIKLITENFEYTLKSANRQKPSAVSYQPNSTEVCWLLIELILKLINIISFVIL